MAAKSRTDGFDEFMADQNDGEEIGTEVVVPERMYSDEDLRAISSFDDALALATEGGRELFSAAEEMGNGFTVLNGKDKDKIVGVMFVALSWAFNEGDAGPFVSMTIVTKHGEKYIVNDGGAGLYRQMRAYSDRTGRFGQLTFPTGLRVSRDYDTVDAAGNAIKATTYYAGQ